MKCSTLLKGPSTNFTHKFGIRCNAKQIQELQLYYGKSIYMQCLLSLTLTMD